MTGQADSGMLQRTGSVATRMRLTRHATLSLGERWGFRASYWFGVACIAYSVLRMSGVL